MQYKQQLTWKMLAGATWILQTPMNQIEGQVWRPGVHSRDWIAQAGAITLGRFVDPELAKRNVEQALGI